MSPNQDFYDGKIFLVYLPYLQFNQSRPDTIYLGNVLATFCQIGKQKWGKTGKEKLAERELWELTKGRFTGGD